VSTQLTDAFQYYLDNQDELVKKYNGKVIVIKDGEVLDSFDDELTAVTETQKKVELGTFLVQRVSPGTSAYAQTFHSRVVFS
jgi:hypothetical protein